MKKILILITLLLGLTFADTLQKDYAYVISAIGIKNVEGNVVWQSGNSNQLANGTYKLAPQVIVYDGVTQYVGAATPFTGCLNGRYYNSSGAPDGACFAGGVATSSQNGLMSAADKAKLDGINLSNYALTSHTHDDRYYTESEIETKLANVQSSSLPITGYGSNSLTYYQTSEGFDGNSGWTHYLIANHGDGASYYHYTIGLPFWKAPIYKRQTGNTSSVSGWHTFVTTENLVDMIYPVGSIYTTASGAYPGDLFGGGWTKIGTQLAISGNVVGNGYALGLTNGSTYVGVGGWTTGSLEAGTNAYGTGVGSNYNSVNLGGKTYGVPTKAQLGSNLYKSGLVVDAVNVNVWQRTS